MQTFAFGLLLAAVSGITIVAFRHPNGFARLFPYLLAVVTAVFAGFVLWHVAIEVAWNDLLAYIIKENLDEATAIKQQLRPSYVLITFWYLGAVLFLLLILKLPPFLQVEDGKFSENDEPEDRNDQS